MYKIIDTQIAGREFADGELFKTKEEIRQQLIDFHLDDIEEKKDRKILKKMSLQEILEYGGWDIEEVEEDKTYCHLCGSEEVKGGWCSNKSCAEYKRYEK